MVNSRFDRQERLFGSRGQERLGAVHVGIVGLGGLGSHVAQQLGYLGVRRFSLVDRDAVDDTSLNRLIGASDYDAAESTPKVRVSARVLRAIDPNVELDL